VSVAVRSAMLLETRYTRPMPGPNDIHSRNCPPRPAQYYDVDATTAGRSIDSYNCLLQSPQGAPVEYWTNGRTTIVMYEDDNGSGPAMPDRTVPPRGAKKDNKNDGLRQSLARRMSTATRPPWDAEPQGQAASSLGASGGGRLAPKKGADDRRLVRDSLLAGSVSGMASTVALYPMDLLRTRLQQTSGSAAMTSAAAVPAAPSAAPPANTWTTTTAARSSAMERPPSSLASPWTVFRQVLREGGLRGLYTGMTLPVAAQAVYKGTVFTVNNVTQECLLSYRTLENHKLGRIANGELTLLDRFASGCIGGAVNAWLFVTPVEFVRNQMIALASRRQAEAAHHRPALTTATTTTAAPSSSPISTWGVIQSSVRNHGLSSLWRGATWSIARDGWGCGWFFVTMHYAQEYLRGYGDETIAPSMGVRVVSGGLAGLAFWVASLPLDTVKTWIQSADLSQRQMVVRESIERIQQQEGVRGVIRQLFRGWQVAYGRGIPSAAITISVYSWVYDELQAA
jgi:Mitochondrial carrier protein